MRLTKTMHWFKFVSIICFHPYHVPAPCFCHFLSAVKTFKTAAGIWSPSILLCYYAEDIKSYSLTITLSFLCAGTTIGPPRPSTPVALGWGVGVLGRAETAGRGAVVVACRVLCLCLGASVLLFLTSVWEVMAAGESESTQTMSHNQQLPWG